MIFKNFTIPDSICEPFIKRNKTDELVREDILKHLAKFGNTSISEKTLVLSTYDRGKLEHILNIQLNEPADLIKECQRLTTVKVEGMELAMDPELLDQLKQQAEFYERPLGEYLAEVIQEKLSLIIRGN